MTEFYNTESQNQALNSEKFACLNFSYYVAFVTHNTTEAELGQNFGLLSIKKALKILIRSSKAKGSLQFCKKKFVKTSTALSWVGVMYVWRVF